MKMCGKLVGILFPIVLCSCSLSGDENNFLVFAESFDFGQDQHGWQVDFTDFPAGEGDSLFYELTFAYTNRPDNLGANKKSMMLSGNNHSADLFMFMKKKVTGLSPNTFYTLVFEVELASNAPKASWGPGGSPGESVFLKAGAAGIEPRKVIDGSQYALNIDKGDQNSPGETTVVLGNIAVSGSSGPETSYSLISRNNASMQDSPFIVKSNSQGELWLVVGTDSGFEGVTTVFYTKVNVVFSTAN